MFKSRNEEEEKKIENFNFFFSSKNQNSFLNQPGQVKFHLMGYAFSSETAQVLSTPSKNFEGVFT